MTTLEWIAVGPGDYKTSAPDVNRVLILGMTGRAA